MQVKAETDTSILAVDCGDHIVASLARVEMKRAQVNAISSNGTTNAEIRKFAPDLIVIGPSNLPTRRVFVEHLREMYPDVPVLVLRFETGSTAGEVRGEFLLSDRIQRSRDLQLVGSLRNLFPLRDGLDAGYEYDLVRETTRLITKNFADPDLSLAKIARKIPASTSKLSHILNKQFGISFRRLLRQIRIEEAKRMLATHRYSVKEVAAKTGFNDSHYFSRSFRAVTGINATEYKRGSHDLIFN